MTRHTWNGLIITVLGLFSFFLVTEGIYRTGEVYGDSANYIRQAESEVISDSKHFLLKDLNLNISNTALKTQLAAIANLAGKNGDSVEVQLIQLINNDDKINFKAKYAVYCSNALELNDGETKSSWELPVHAYCEELFSHVVSKKISKRQSIFKKITSIIPISSKPMDQSINKVHWSYIMQCVSILIILMGIGFINKGRWLEVFINEKNRITLERLQIVIWTGIILSAVASYSFISAGVLAHTPKALSLNPTFPKVPGPLLILLGVSIAAMPAIAKGIEFIQGNSGRGNDSDVQAQIAAETLRIRSANLHRPDNPSWKDLFHQHTDDGTKLDFSAIQNLLITFLLTSFYVTLILAMLKNITSESLILAANTGTAIYASLPEINPAFTTLLLASHGAYLAVKATRGVGEVQTPTDGEIE